MSRRSDGKKARRRKRQAARNEAWIPPHVIEELKSAAALEDFDGLLTARGWEFSDESLDEDAAGVAWWWPASQAEVDDPEEQVDATVVLLTPEDGGEIAHVVLVGTGVDHQFGLDELVGHLDSVEAYRHGAPLPTF